jgi:hypothetical protein
VLHTYLLGGFDNVTIRLPAAPSLNNPGHYTTNPRYFYNFATGQIITM